MKHILVPTDFSDTAANALKWAIKLARLNKAEITLLHAMEDFREATEIAIATEKMRKINQLTKETESFGIHTVLSPDDAVNAIIDGIEKHKTDVIIMGTVGCSGIQELLYGSRTASVIGKSTVPVLAVPPHAEWKLPKKILLAINRLDDKKSQVLPVMKLARLFSATVHVAIFTDTDDDFVEDYDEHGLKIAQYRDVLKEQYMDVEIHAVHLAGHHFRENMNNWIANNAIDIVAMLKHKKSLIETIFEGSMTKKMAHHSTIPLLAIPA